MVWGSLLFPGSPPSSPLLLRVVRVCGLAFLAVGCLALVPFSSRLVFVMSLSSVGFVLPVGFVASPVAAPVAAAPVAGFVPFVPASLAVGSAVVPASAFLPVASGVVSGLSGLGVRASGGFSVVVGGRSFRCLASGLGGAGSPAFLGLLASLRSARASGAVVSLVGAPGRGGRVCSGFFCGLVAVAA